MEERTRWRHRSPRQLFIAAFTFTFTLTLLLVPLSAHAHEYLGCYKDEFASTERDLISSLLLGDKDGKTGPSRIDPDVCEEFCGKKGFKYVGVQYGSECWCGDSYGRHGKLDEPACSVPCLGAASYEPKNRCGGGLANSIFKITKQFEADKPDPSQANRPLLGLVMIVKDEAHTLGNTLGPLAPYLDTYHILDTGSTDGTQDVIRKTLSNIEGQIYEEPFIDYGRSRNRALELAQQSTKAPIFSLMLSADETVLNPQALRTFCEQHRYAEGAMHEAYPIQMDVGWRFDSLRLSRTDKGWRYVGRVHEYLAAPDRKWRPSLRVPDVVIRFRVTDPERRGKREHKIRDILIQELEENPKDTRATFYLARTYNVLKNHSEALVYFKKRIDLGGWAEEVYESYYAIAFQLEAMGRPWPEIHEAFLAAHNHSPNRGEPLHNIAQHYYRDPNAKALAYPYAAHCASLPYPKAAVLWVQADVYNWQCLQLQGLTGHIVKKYAEGYTALLKALKVKPNDENMKSTKAIYEKAMTNEEKIKAECAAGVAQDTTKCPVGFAPPCPHMTADGAGGAADSIKPGVAQRIATEELRPEQSNFAGSLSPDKGGALNAANQLIPASLRDRYGPITSTTDGVAGWMMLLIGMMVGVLMSMSASVVARRIPMLNRSYLRIFGGKSASRMVVTRVAHAIDGSKNV